MLSSLETLRGLSILSPNSSHPLCPFPPPPLSVTGQAFRAPSTESRGLGATSRCVLQRLPGMKYCFLTCGPLRTGLATFTPGH